MAGNTYSFLDVKATLVGPGGGPFTLGAGAGNSEEGITIAMAEDKNTLTVGADGMPMHSLHAAKHGTVTVHLLKTSPVNALLSNLYAVQTQSSALHGQNVIVVTNPVTGDSITCQACAFKKLPDQKNAKEAGTNDWAFDAGIIDMSLAGLLLSVGG